MEAMRQLMPDYPFPLETLLFVTRAGSHAYGLNTPTSDDDYRGVAVPPADYVLGLREWEQYQARSGDVVVYSLKKFANLALKANPNVLELLYTRDSDLLYLSPAGEKLRVNRHLFLTARAFHAFGGYAHAKLKALAVKGKRAIGQLPEGETVDWKDAMHLLRLLRMGVEVLRTGEVHVFREDREELLAVRRGEWPMEKVLAEADRLEQELREAYARTPLPPEPDFERVNQLVMELVRDVLHL